MAPREKRRWLRHLGITGLVSGVLLTGSPVVADTDDVIDDFLPAATDVWNCAGHALAVWADMDEDGTYDTQVVFTTLSSAGDAGESSVETEFDGSGKWFFFSFIDAHCGGSDPYVGRGRFAIHFVDILAAGFVWNDPATWTYKSVPAVSLKVTHDACFGYDDPRYDDPGYTAYLGVQAYRERSQTDLVAPVSEESVGGWRTYRFSNAEGLKEIYLSTDFCENTLDELRLYTHEIGPDGEGGVPELGLLFDTSGSMSWSHEGATGVPADEQRLTHAKDAAIPIIEMMNDFNTGAARFSISRFPSQPYLPGTCNGQSITPSTVIDAASAALAVGTTIPGLTTADSTPLLAGLSSALSGFANDGPRAVVLLSDGYHNCPSTVESTDDAVTTAIANASAAGASIFTIGFGRPSDVDHPLLERLASSTDGRFYDVTGPTFDPATFDPRTALAEAYVAILGDALGLETGADPRGVIKAGETVTREVAVNRRDEQVSFYLSWATRVPHRLGLTIRSSDGVVVPPSAGGIRVHDGPTYRVVTVDRPFLEQPGKVGETPWSIEIAAPAPTTTIAAPTAEYYQYSVLMDSPLAMDPRFIPAKFATGETVLLTARLSQGGQPLTGIESVEVRVTRPEDGLGNWFAANRVSAEELAKIPEKVGDELLSGATRKARFLTDVRKIPLPGLAESGVLRLYDDGTHGDTHAGDGIYSSPYSDTVRAGTYAFQFRASGRTEDGSPFQREKRIERYVGVHVAAANTDVATKAIASHEPKLRRFEVVVTPKDALGNRLGPRYASLLAVTPSWGRLVGAIRDNLDGTYTQVIELPAGQRQPVDLQVRVGGESKAVSWTAPGSGLGWWLPLLLIALLLVLLVWLLLSRRRGAP